MKRSKKQRRERIYEMRNLKKKDCTEQTTHCKIHNSSDDRQDKVKMTINKENNRNRNNNNNNDSSSSDSSNDNNKLS